MKRTSMTLVWGGLLILAGILLLLQNLAILNLSSIWAGFWALLFFLGGAGFLWVSTQNRDNWWALIPGFAGLGLGALVAMGAFAPSLAGLIGASTFLGALSLAFWLIYLTHHEHWWAIIPGGVLATIAVMVFVEQVTTGDGAPGILFMGMAATFALVGLVPTPAGRMTWAFIPAGVLFLIGLVVFTPVAGAINYVWPLALILGGGYLLFRALVNR